MIELSFEWLRGPAAVIFVFGLVIFVHELGHFVVAKWAGVYAPRFSIGFGPALWKKRVGETEYVLAAIPLGGYVRMASRDDETMALIEGGGEKPHEEPTTVGGSGAQVVPGEELPAARRRSDDWDPEAMAPFGPKPVPEHRMFESKSLPARLAIMLAGVTMNALLALLIFIALALFVGRPVPRSTVIAAVTAPATAPELSERILPGDTVRAVNGAAVGNWGDVIDGVLRDTGDTLRITTHRDDVAIPVGVAGAPSRAEVAAALEPQVPPVIEDVLPESAARRAGLQRGDSVIAIDGRPVASWRELVANVQASPLRAMEMTVGREGETRVITVTPDSITRPGDTVSTGYLGAGSRTDWIPLGPGDAIVQGWRETRGMTVLVLGALRDLVTGRASMRQLGGPVRIAQASAQAAESGLSYLFRLTAFISINLAILNLLPIPILDGGQIILNLVEAVRGSPLSVRAREYVMRFGLATILLIFVFVMFNDIRRLLGL
jgi:regulator of sigma E protease